MHICTLLKYRLTYGRSAVFPIVGALLSSLKNESRILVSPEPLLGL